MRLDLKESVISLVKSKFHSAKLNGSLLFSATELAVIRAGGLSYQLRYCPALSKKPEWEKPIPSDTDTATVPAATKTKIDPFLDPPEALLIAEVPAAKPSHLLVLNKYPVIPNHFILATKPYKDQRKLLEQDDLAATWACLREWEADVGHAEPAPTTTKRLFAFFNSGKDSGASQPHRHIQFLPVDDMLDGGVGEGWRLPLDDAHDHASPPSSLGFPFVHFTAPLRPSLGPCDIHDAYMALYRRAVSAVKAYNARGGGAHDAIEMVHDSENEGWAEISYNLALTTSMMALCPRRTEDAYIEASAAEQGTRKEKLGPISLNGTILAANLMVKSEAEWDALRQDESRLRDVLEAVGLPVDNDDQGSHPGARL